MSNYFLHLSHVLSVLFIYSYLNITVWLVKTVCYYLNVLCTVTTQTNLIIFLSLPPSMCLFHSLSVFQIPHRGVLVSNAMTKSTRCSQQKSTATRHNLDPISII